MLRDRLGDAFGELDVTRSQHEEHLAVLRAEHERSLAEREATLAQEHASALAEVTARLQQGGRPFRAFAGLDAPGVVGRESTGQPKDDLQRIEGIGPRIEQALVSSGVTTYRDVSRASEQRLRAALEASGLSFAPSLTTWAEQATLLARGDEEGFALLTARLIADKDRK